MEQFLEFAINHWMLTSILIALLILLAWDSSHKAGPKVSTHEATRLINQNNALVLDIREKKDFKAGHLVDAVNIPFASLATKLDELKDKERPVIVVCKSGQSASAASKQLKDAGFASVYRLQGGMMEWTNNNLPVVTK